MPHAYGVLLLLAVALAALLLILAGVVVHGFRRPPRRTAAYAVARGMPCDPGEAGFRFGSWTLDLPDGARLPVWDLDLETGVGPGFTVVLLHGWGQSRIDGLGRVRSLREHAGRVILYDLRGHGEAEGAPSALGHGEADDLIALLERLGAGRVVLAGHGMGAVIAIRAAAASAPGVEIAGVVAEAPYLDLHAALRARLRRGGGPTRPLTDLAMLWLWLRGVRPRPLLAAAAAVPCPLLVVAADAGVATAPDDGARVAEAAPDGTLVRVADAAARDAAVARFLGSLHAIEDAASRSGHR